MRFLLMMVEFLATLILVVLLGLVSAVVFEAYRRCHNNAHVEAPAIFEDPKSLKQVPCPYIFYPAEKYLSLIIPAFNEEHRLPGALGETMNYLQKGAAKDKSFSYEVHSRGELLPMLDADGATKVTDLEKLENQIHDFARKDVYPGNSAPSNTSFRISDVPIVGFGSRAQLEEKALATRKWSCHFLMKGFHLVVLSTAGPGIRDTQCSFKMFTRSAARKLFTNIRLERLLEENISYSIVEK